MNAKYFILASVAGLSLQGASTLHAGGTVVAWGQNSYQQTNVPVGLVNIQAIAAGSDTNATSRGFSMALKPDGNISVWGDNNFFEPNVPAPASNIIAIAAGEYHGVALRTDGRVFAWGRNNFFQTNVPNVLASNVVAIAAGASAGDFSLALRSDGTVVGWGNNSFGQTNVSASATNAVALAAGAAHGMALRADGSVVAWGLGGQGQLAIPPNATSIVAIAAGSYHCLALRTNGTVAAWGHNVFGQASVPPTATNVVAIAAGDQHSLALRRDGTLLIWGNTNTYGFFPPAGLSNVVGIASAARHGLAIMGDGSPGITVPLRSQAVYPGSKAVFVVMAAGPGNLTYQWQANGQTISGATGSILVLSNVQPANSGWYQVTVRNSLGSDTASAGLTLLDGRINITQPPATTTSVDANSNATLTVTAVGAVPISYQWWKDGNPILNATNFNYAITNAQATNGGAYFVVVSNSYGAVLSSTDTVSVVYYPPSFITQPLATNVPVGAGFALSAAVTGTTPLSWQWRSNSTPIPGATGTNYVVAAAQISDGAAYDVVVTNRAGLTSSVPVVVNVGYAPVVTQPPLPLTKNAGEAASFNCVVTGTPPLSLQWTLNGYPLAGQTNSSLTLPGVQAGSIGYYALVATNIFGNAVSSNAALNINGFNFSQTAGLVAYYPLDGDATDASGNGNHGTNFGAAGVSDRFGNTNSALGFGGAGDYIQCKSGAYFASRFTITAWLKATAYRTYSRILDFGNGSAVDNTDLAFSEANTGHPYLEAYYGGTRQAWIGTSVSLPLNIWVQVVATCDGSQVAIYTNGVLEASGGAAVDRPAIPTTRNYIGKSNWADQNFAGRFDDIRILNRALSANEVAQLFALEADMPVITQQPMPQTVDAGSTVGFSVVATANHPLTYQWRVNDVPIAGATDSVLTISNAQAANIGFYSVSVSNSFAGVFSTAALLNLTAAPDPTTLGLVAYYPLDGNANDSGTNALSGATNGNAVWTTNRFGVASSALALDGSTGFVSVNDPGALLNFDIRSNNYTVSTWVQFNAPLPKVGEQCILIDRGTVLNPPTSYTLTYSETLDAFFIQMWDGGAFVQVNSAAAAVYGRWYHLAAVVANRVVRLYVNGVDVSVPSSNGGIAPGNFGTTKNLEGVRNFGRFAGGGYGSYLNGSLDDIRFYNRALSSGEVAHLYALDSQSSVTPPPALTASLGAGPSFNLSFTGAPGSNYVLQSATNLAAPVQWSSLVTNTAGPNGLWQAVDTNLNSARKFYRVTTP